MAGLDASLASKLAICLLGSDPLDPLYHFSTELIQPLTVCRSLKPLCPSPFSFSQSPLSLRSSNPLNKSPLEQAFWRSTGHNLKHPEPSNQNRLFQALRTATLHARQINPRSVVIFMSFPQSIVSTFDDFACIEPTPLCIVTAVTRCPFCFPIALRALLSRIPVLRYPERALVHCIAFSLSARVWLGSRSTALVFVLGPATARPPSPFRPFNCLPPAYRTIHSHAQTVIWGPDFHQAGAQLLQPVIGLAQSKHRSRPQYHLQRLQQEAYHLRKLNNRHHHWFSSQSRDSHCLRKRPAKTLPET